MPCECEIRGWCNCQESNKKNQKARKRGTPQNRNLSGFFTGSKKWDDPIEENWEPYKDAVVFDFSYRMVWVS